MRSEADPPSRPRPRSIVALYSGVVRTALTDPPDRQMLTLVVLLMVITARTAPVYVRHP